MFRLTREVRFAINDIPDEQLSGPPSNSYAGFPSMTGLGHFFTLQVTLAGELQPHNSYLRNIKEIDQQVRRIALPIVGDAVRQKRFNGGAQVLTQLFDLLRNAWTGNKLDSLKLSLTPHLSLAIQATEYPMVRLSQKFEFSASHRLHNPALSDEENRNFFGKCNNPNGHGHNYELQVTLAGKPDEKGMLMDVPAFERVVATTVIDRFDHKNLNIELAEFRAIIPSVENIAMVIFHLLKPRLETPAAHLTSVTVWETSKTLCEYSE